MGTGAVSVVFFLLQNEEQALDLLRLLQGLPMNLAILQVGGCQSFIFRVGRERIVSPCKCAHINLQLSLPGALLALLRRCDGVKGEGRGGRNEWREGGREGGWVSGWGGPLQLPHPPKTMITVLPVQML